MSYLFVDTTHHLINGLLDSKFEWIQFEESFSKKNSAEIHANIFEILQKEKLDVQKLSGAIFMAGPGSYTGMRISEGIAQIFEWQNIPVFSFYHYDVPNIMGIGKGLWFSEAFKGEIFTHKWDGEKYSRDLVAREEFLTRAGKGELSSPLYTNFTMELDPNLETEQTSEAIKQKPGEVLGAIVRQKERKSPYYFRDIEKEFKVNKTKF